MQCHLLQRLLSGSYNRTWDFRHSVNAQLKAGSTVSSELHGGMMGVHRRLTMLTYYIERVVWTGWTNLYYLLRFSRAGHDRLERLVEFLHYLFGPTGCTRRAVALAPTDYSVLHTLSDDLARRGNWTAALSRLEQALRVGCGQSREHERLRLAQSMIRAVAAGHAGRVKQMMEEAGIVESMEPLWHAVRLELGEELEPLPAEILEAVSVICQMVAGSTMAPHPRGRIVGQEWRAQR